MTKKKTTENTEAIQQEVNRRFKDVRTSTDLNRVLLQATGDVVSGKISLKLCDAITRRAGNILKETERQLREK